MSDRDPTPRTPWIRESEPWVPEPTMTGRVVLRMWIEEQLRLVAEARQRRRASRRRHGPEADGDVGASSGRAQEE